MPDLRYMDIPFLVYFLCNFFVVGALGGLDHFIARHDIYRILTNFLT